MKLSERLVELRNKRGLTQAHMAEILGVKRPRYNAWEQGLSQPNIEMLAAIADYHNVSVDYLTGRSEMKNAELERVEELEADVRVIQRAAMDMNPEQRKEALKMWDFLFKDVVKNAKRQEGVDDNNGEDN